MRIITSLAMAAALGLGLTACGGEAGDWKKRYQKIIDEGCACKDEACFEKATEKRRELRKDFREKYKDNKDKGKKIGESLEGLDKKWDECRDKREKTETPATP